MLDVMDILSDKWASFLNQTRHQVLTQGQNVSGGASKRAPGKRRAAGEDKEETAVIDELCDMANKMSMPERVTDSRSVAKVLTDNLFVERASGLTEGEVREAVKTWLSVEDDPEVLAEEVDLELQEVEHNFNGIELDDGKSGEEEDDGVRPDSCITTSITEAEVRARLEDVRSYLHAEGMNGENSDSLYLLSKTVHSFTHETEVKLRAKERGQAQSTLRDAWKS